MILKVIAPGVVVYYESLEISGLQQYDLRDHPNTTYCSSEFPATCRSFQQDRPPLIRLAIAIITPRQAAALAILLTSKVAKTVLSTATTPDK